jgi:hypothetical protein
MRLIRVSSSSLVLRWAVATSALASATLGAPDASAQSAADKATARTLATEGIKLFREGKFAESLDKMQRAQAMYDAPVHVLYIARCQVKLDKLVEGAENYRRLVRTPLDANAPPAFKEAIESAGKELEEIEPKVPTLRVEVEPANAAQLEIRIDGEVMPVAALGIDRPANPGWHTVQAWAPGYAPSESKIELKAGEKKPLKLVLQPGSGPPPPGFTAPPPGQQQPGMVPGPMPPPGAEGGATGSATQEPASKVGFMVGLRLGGAFPGGAARSDPSGEDVKMGDLFQAGGGGEIHGGVRLFKYFTGVVYFERHVLKPGEFFDVPTQAIDLEVTNTAFAQSYGIGAMIGTPRNQLGGFGEIDLVLDHRFEVNQEINSSDPRIRNGRCERAVSARGPAFRIGGGMNIPVAEFLHLTPFVMATFGQFTDNEVDTDCPAELFGPDVDGEIPEAQRAAHSLLFFGVGGDFVLGRDKPGP